MLEFEQQKRHIRADTEKSRISINILYEFNQLFEKKHEGNRIPDHIKKANEPGVRFVTGKLVLSHERSKQLFGQAFHNIKVHLLNLLAKDELKSVSSILMVGGFSECQLLQDEIHVLFGIKSSYGLRIIVPASPQLSVLHGAVAFGHNPTEVSARIARMTYGFKTSEKFDPSVHDDTHLLTKRDGTKICQNVFTPIAKLGEEIIFGEIRSTIRTFLSHENRVNAHVSELSKYLRRHSDNGSVAVATPSSAVTWIAKGLLGLNYEQSSPDDFPYELYEKIKAKYGQPHFKGQSKIEHFIHQIKIEYYNFLRWDIQSKSIYAMKGSPIFLKHYVTEPECCKIGEVQIRFPPEIKHSDMDVEIKVEFGSTEMKMTCNIIETKESATAKIDFL